MNDLDQRVVDYKRDLEMAELDLQQAELELTHGGRHLDEAKEKYGKLKIAVEKAKVELRRQQWCLKKAEADAQKGFVEDLS